MPLSKCMMVVLGKRHKVDDGEENRETIKANLKTENGNEGMVIVFNK